MSTLPTNFSSFADPATLLGSGGSLSVPPSTNWAQLGSALSMIPAAAFPTVGSQSGTTSSNLSTGQNVSGNSTTSSGYGSAGTTAIAQLLPLISKLATNTNLAPYQAQQTEAINNASNANANNINADLASRGLSRSPVASTAMANNNAQRIAATTNLQQQIPLLQNQLTQQNSGAIASILSQLPKTTTGTTGQTGTTTQSGSTAQNVNSSSGGGIAGLFGGLGAALASL
jgi:hypothetical protein